MFKMNNKCCRNKEGCCQNKEEKSLLEYMKLGFAFWLTIVFVALKVFGAIDWTWLWVLSPLWIGYGIIVLLLFVYITLSALAGQTRKIRLKLTKKQKEIAED